MAAMKKPHPSTRTERSFELVVRERPYPVAITPAEKEANKTLRVVDKRFDRIRARSIDGARREARTVLEAEGYEILGLNFAEGNRIAAVVQPKTATRRGPALPISSLKRRG